MLVLTRKTQEAVIVGGSVGFERMLKITVIDKDGRPRGPGGLRENQMSHSRPLPLPNAVPAEAPKFGILVADDEPAIRNLLRVSLSRQGFAVWLAADGQEAVELYRRHYAGIDVVLLDVRMPELDGPRTLLALLQLNPALRCCFMSGDLGMYAESRLMHLGARFVIRKPFQAGEVAERLWELAGNLDGRAPAYDAADCLPSK